LLKRRCPKCHAEARFTGPQHLSPATTCLTTREGVATVFLAVDHCAADCVGIHAARPGTRFEALEPLRQGIREHLGGYSADIARGLALRHDHGSQFMSDHFQDELRFLGITSSPAFVREPEGNGCVERFIRTLKEQLLWVRTFETVEELRLALLEFKERYNREWLIERHRYATPQQARQRLLACPVVAAWGVDLARGVASIVQTAQRLNGVGVVMQPTKSASGRRGIALDQDTVAVLKAHRARQNELRLALGAARQENGLVFSGPLGEPMNPNRLSHAFHDLAHKAGSPGLRLHDLRHGHAAGLIEAGVHAKVVQERLGHASAAFTMQVYGHVAAGLQADAAQRFAGLMADRAGSARG